MVGPFTHVAVDLGGEDDLFPAPAALGKPAPDDLLGDAFADLPAIDIGGVEKVDAQFEGFIHDGKRIGLAGLRAEVHRAQAQPGDL